MSRLTTKAWNPNLSCRIQERHSLTCASTHLSLSPLIRRTEVVSHLYKATIESVALFQNLEKDVIISICIALDHTVVLKKDFIIVSTTTVVAARGCAGSIQHLQCVNICVWDVCGRRI